MSNNPTQIGRRQFLIASSTCAVAAATVGPDLFAGVATGPVRRLAIGFSPAGETTEVFRAASLRRGDSEFLSRGARVTVSGASGTSAPADRRAVELLAHFPMLDGAKQSFIPFRAWASSRTSGAQGGPGIFTMPVDDARLVFSVEAERGKPAGKAPTRRDSLFGRAATDSVAHPVVLSLQNESRSLKLVRGSYVIVPLFEGEREPDWSSLELRSGQSRLALYDRNGEVASFDHFVLSVDYATKA